MVDGRIVSSVAGDYGVAVDNSGEVIVCKARGLFRLKKITPCIGDYVTLVIENSDYVISEIKERRNMLVRPPLANLDCAVIVVSAGEPRPNALIMDKLTVIFENKGIESVLVFTKIDRFRAEYFEVYKRAGFSCFSIDNTTGEGVGGLCDFLQGKTSALIGNTGVGKTSLLNRLIPGTERPTAEISKKLGRGKHTTRTVELHGLPYGGFVADTPGFSTVETRLYGAVESAETVLHFREFAEFLGRCKFGGCTHLGEDGCAICEAVESGGISRSRYDSYVSIYEEARKAETTY